MPSYIAKPMNDRLESLMFVELGWSFIESIAFGSFGAAPFSRAERTITTGTGPLTAR